MSDAVQQSTDHTQNALDAVRKRKLDTCDGLIEEINNETKAALSRLAKKNYSDGVIISYMEKQGWYQKAAKKEGVAWDISPNSLISGGYRRGGVLLMSDGMLVPGYIHVPSGRYKLFTAVTYDNPDFLAVSNKRRRADLTQLSKNELRDVYDNLRAL